MRAIDTNVMVRLVIGDDPEQTHKAEAFIRLGAWVSHLVLAEAVWVLSSAYRLSHSQQVTAIEFLLEIDCLSFQNRETVVAALQLFRQQSSRSFSDCLILEIARKAGHLPLGTFDRKLGAVEGVERL